MFQIDVTGLSWIDGRQDDPEDLCAHGHAVAQIGDETFAYDATVSATALYLLKSLSEDHWMGEGEQFLPCCGFSIYARDDTLSAVDIIGCPNGVDWSVVHDGGLVRLVTPSGRETLVSRDEYQKTVYAFADKVEAFYQSCGPKVLPGDKLDREGYLAFWNEWHRLRAPGV